MVHPPTLPSIAVKIKSPRIKTAQGIHMKRKSLSNFGLNLIFPLSASRRDLNDDLLHLAGIFADAKAGLMQILGEEDRKISRRKNASRAFSLGRKEGRLDLFVICLRYLGACNVDQIHALLALGDKLQIDISFMPLEKGLLPSARFIFLNHSEDFFAVDLIFSCRKLLIQSLFDKIKSCLEICMKNRYNIKVAKTTTILSGGLLWN